MAVATKSTAPGMDAPTMPNYTAPVSIFKQETKRTRKPKVEAVVEEPVAVVEAAPEPQAEPVKTRRCPTHTPLPK